MGYFVKIKDLIFTFESNLKVNALPKREPSSEAVLKVVRGTWTKKTWLKKLGNRNEEFKKNTILKINKLLDRIFNA